MNMPFSTEGRLEHIANWTTWLGRFIDTPAHGLEIGCFEGRATKWFLDNILTHHASSMTVIDTFKGGDDHLAAGVNCNVIRNNFDLNLESHSSRLIVNHGRSDVMLPALRFRQFKYDFIYVDGSHNAPDVLVDLVLSWLLLADGGILIADDYEWKFRGPLTEPKLAIDAFLEIYGHKFKLLHKGWQVALERL
jgi:hypothetical protein